MGGYGDDSKKKKKIIIIATCSLILIAMVVGVAVNATQQENGSKDAPKENTQAKASMKAVAAICSPTDYKKECIDSLGKVAGNTTNPKELIKMAFTVTVNKINEAIKNSTTIKTLANDPRAKLALSNCGELMNYAIDDLKHSFERLGALDISKIDELLEDLKIWLSGAVSYQETCLDGFKNTTGDAGEKMRKFLTTSGRLTSNALAIVADFNSFLKSLNLPMLNRRLLSEGPVIPKLDDQGLPNWASSSKRNLLQTPLSKLKPNVTVAKDGSGDFKTITDALKKVPKKNTEPFVIRIKEGVYKETVLVTKDQMHVVFIGDGPTKTKITGSKNYAKGITTYLTATVAVIGQGFMAKDIGFENTAGPEGHQAVALRVQSDMSVFYKCQMDGYQDTLYAQTHRQFYRDCTISGTIDFVFGDAASIFQNCKFVLRRPGENQKNIVTAHGRKDRREATAIIIQGGSIVADSTLEPVKDVFPSYLGRPWKEFSRTIIMNTKISDVIHPDGWLPWMGTWGINTCVYAELNNKGPGASTKDRVKWRGVKKITAEHAERYTPEKFISGTRWIPTTGVPYVPGMMSS